MANLNLNDFSGVIGTPYNPIQQAYEDTCAIKSQQLILNEFGVPVTEDQLVQYSIEQGWYNGNGTAMQDVGRILADAGIPCTQSVDANIYDLVNELSQGHKVIVAVDSSELRENNLFNWLNDSIMGETPDHALIVAGIDMSDPNNPMVILTDPGTGELAAPCPIDQFMNAWADSQHFMVSTDIPTPAAVDSFTSNGMIDMHLPEIAGVDYNTFLEFQSYSHLIEPTLLPELNFAFQTYPTMPIPDFSMAIENVGLPYFEPSLYMPTPMVFDPKSFDYCGLGNPWLPNEFDSAAEYYSAIKTSSIDSETYNKLSDLHQDALDHAQHCLDDGDYFYAQLWQSEARHIQSDMNDYM